MQPSESEEGFIMEFIIRKATEKDFDVIQALNAALFAEDERNDDAIDTHWPMSVEGVEYYMKSLMDPRKLVLIAEDQSTGKPIGYLIASSENKWRWRVVATGELENMYVVSRTRRQGVGKALVDRAKEWVKTRGIERFYVSAYAKNSSARAFYESVGFLLWETGLEARIT